MRFDFLGWGASDKPRGYPYTFANLVGDLDAVITQLFNFTEPPSPLAVTGLEQIIERLGDSA